MSNSAYEDGKKLGDVVFPIIEGMHKNFKLINPGVKFNSVFTVELIMKMDDFEDKDINERTIAYIDISDEDFTIEWAYSAFVTDWFGIEIPKKYQITKDWAFNKMKEIFPKIEKAYEDIGIRLLPLVSEKNNMVQYAQVDEPKANEDED